MELVTAYGHPNVTGRHRTTFEVTKDREISKRADCIIGVGADKGICELGEDFKTRARNSEATIEVTLVADGVVEKITGKGHPRLTFTHETDIVIRKSKFICERTLMIKADKASIDLSRELMEKMKNPDQRIEVKIAVK